MLYENSWIFCCFAYKLIFLALKRINDFCCEQINAMKCSVAVDTAKTMDYISTLSTNS